MCQSDEMGGKWGWVLEGENGVEERIGILMDNPFVMLYMDVGGGRWTQGLRLENKGYLGSF